MNKDNSVLPSLEQSIGLILISNRGDLRFTARGREFFGPRLARYGVHLSNIKTVAQYEAIQNKRTFYELVEIDPSTERFRKAGVDPFQFLDDLLDDKLTFAEICEMCKKVNERSLR